MGRGKGNFLKVFFSLRLLPLFSNGFLRGLNAPSTPCYSFSADFPSFINHSSHTHLSFFQRSRLGVRLIVMQMAKGPMCVSHTGIGPIQLGGSNFQKGGFGSFSSDFQPFFCIQGQAKWHFRSLLYKESKNVNLALTISITYVVTLNISQNIVCKL